MKLVWLLVTLACADPMLDWEHLIWTSRSWGTSRATGLVLTRASRHLGAHVPSGVLRALRGRSGWGAAETSVFAARQRPGPVTRREHHTTWPEARWRGARRRRRWQVGPARRRRSFPHGPGRVGVAQAVDALPRGLDTVLGIELEDGSDLSGGQWQRVALARALYRDSPLVVLDKPSAALDPRAEHELFADVRRVIDGRSVVLISHRYSSARLAAHIYVMVDGRVAEHGSHDELMASQGRYAELYELQSRTCLGP